MEPWNDNRWSDCPDLTEREAYEELMEEEVSDEDWEEEFERRKVKEEDEGRIAPPVGATLVDDNFGTYHDTDDPDVVEFYAQVQRESVPTECQGCGRTFNLRPGYGFCNSCADKRERGMDF